MEDDIDSEKGHDVRKSGLSENKEGKNSIFERQYGSRTEKKVRRKQVKSKNYSKHL